MAEPIRKLSIAKQVEAVSLGELIHQAVRAAIERAVQEELEEALGAGVYERGEGRRGYRNGHRERTLSGPTGPAALTVPRATLFTESGKREWSSKMLPRYQRRMPELNEAIIATYLSGANTRRIKGALKPLLNAAPLSKSSVSRVVSTMQSELAAWRTRSLSELKPIYLYLDAFALRRREVEDVLLGRLTGRLEHGPLGCRGEPVDELVHAGAAERSGGSATEETATSEVHQPCGRTSTRLFSKRPRLRSTTVLESYGLITCSLTV